MSIIAGSNLSSSCAVKLAVFDIDGTLVNTNRVDSDCFVRAFAEEFSISDIDVDWTRYDNATNAGIAQAIFHRVFHRVPEEFEIKRLQSRFLRLLQDVHTSKPDLFLEIPGALRFFKFLSGHAKWKVAIATGGWYEDAALKLKAAGFSLDGIPLSTSNEAVDRDSIFKSCIEKSCSFYSVDRFTKIVALGDSSWDVTAARALNVAFIGIGDRTKLTELGAVHAVEDYKDLNRVMNLLELACVPNQGSLA
jgi:phosphoglycolate phosphatase-like HAD superfamily hydrolase